MKSPLLLWSLALALLLASGPALSASMEAVTFAAEPGKAYVPLEEATSRLRWSTSQSIDGALTRLNGQPLPSGTTRLVNGTHWIPLDSLSAAGADILTDLNNAHCEVVAGRRRFTVSTGVKRIEVDLARQRLCAYQGSVVVLETNISSGRHGSTPSGKFTVGPYKSRMHYSSKYHNAPMPWSIQITGHIFFHGFSSVPNYPASHGCIRIPLTGANPARFLFEWADVGTPIQIANGRKEEVRRALPPN
jgi:hypothetical protein